MNPTDTPRKSLWLCGRMAAHTINCLQMFICRHVRRVQGYMDTGYSFDFGFVQHKFLGKTIPTRAYIHTHTHTRDAPVRVFR